MADSSFFSSLLKTVFTNHLSTVKFQVQNETSNQDIVRRANPTVAEAELELVAEGGSRCANLSSISPAATSVSTSVCASAISKPLSARSTNNSTSLRRTVLESPAADGYGWRKYGQKQVKGSESSRSYYRCSHSNCLARKRVQRSHHSGQVIDTAYIGQHNHDLTQNQSDIAIGSSSPSKFIANSQSVASDLSADLSICCEDSRQSLVHMAESEQHSSSSSNGNPGNKVNEQNGNDPESIKLEVRLKKKRDYGNANAKVQEKLGAERGHKRRMKESGSDATTFSKASNEQTKIVVLAAADGSMLSDGFRWRKYGRKMVKGNSRWRSYYRCTSAGCPSRKHVETAVGDATSATITYEGNHDHDMPIPKKQKGSENLAHNSPANTANYVHCKRVTGPTSSQRFSYSTEGSVDMEGDMIDEQVLELGGQMALESAQTLLSIGVGVRPC